MSKFVSAVVLAAAALVGSTSSAYAAVTINTSFKPGSTPNSSLTNAVVFQSFTTNAANGTPVVAGSGPYTQQSGVSGESKSGVVNYYQGDVSGQAVGPVVNPGTGSFASILNGSYTVTFVGAQVFSFIYGGLDSYNSVTLNFLNSPSKTLLGAEICGIANSGCALGSTGRVTYDFGGTDILKSVVLSSNQAAFEIDELASSAPEPAAWALMILGFGLVGSQLRRRKGKPALAAA